MFISLAPPLANLGLAVFVWGGLAAFATSHARRTAHGLPAGPPMRQKPLAAVNHLGLRVMA
jgi:hypothetical protein